MKYTLFAIRDENTGESGFPIPSLTLGVLIRSLALSIIRKEDPVAIDPKSFTVHEIGSYCPRTNCLVGYDDVTNHGTVYDLINSFDYQQASKDLLEKATEVSKAQ